MTADETKRRVREELLDRAELSPGLRVLDLVFRVMAAVGWRNTPQTYRTIHDEVYALRDAGELELREVGGYLVVHLKGEAP